MGRIKSLLDNKMTHTPTGPIKGGMGGAMKNGYDMWTQGSAGLWIKDVTRCGELIYDAE